MSRWMIAKNDYLMHYGIPGQKWGVRNYMDEHGRLTQAGRERYKSDYEFEYDGKTASSRGYSQDKSLSGQKNYIESLKTKIKGLQGKENKDARDATRKALKAAQQKYRDASKADKAHYQESKKAAKAELKKEEEGLKTIHNYITGNKRMANSVNRKNLYEEIIGKYNGRSDSDIQKRKSRNENIANNLHSENERVRDMDIKEATSEDNLKKFRKYKKG